MSVEMSSADIYANVTKLRKVKVVDNSSDLIYENYQKPQKEEKLNAVGPPEPATNVSYGKAAKSSGCFLLWSLTLCLLLVASIGIIIWFGVELVKRQEELREQVGKVRRLENRTEELKEERGNFENQTKQLSLEKILLQDKVQQLSRLKEAILASENFPVKDFCPDKQCQPCQTNWVQFQGKCYLFYEAYCETWSKAQEFCRSKAADLVLVDNLQEQEFLKNHLTSYSSCWSSCQFYSAGSKPFGYWTDRGLMTFQGNLIHSWNTAGYSDINKFICEGEVMVWPK
ncbi:C-type lectin domain family 12 member B-like [Poecilia formosa]|uniref:C-type lectin domain family 12 member B-like n=1 Tax=Poecilia formosa TaxID=48698 RepID=UPI000443912F|nr:PREDICTED: C-type lectin domain family 12 member B-like [Poecilia formosa]